MIRTTCRFEFIGILLIFTISLHAQKVEIEKRIDSASFPDKSHEFLKAGFPGMSGAKYYIETNKQGMTFEAKFESDGADYSVEFSSNGEWLDTEMTIPHTDLENSIFENINKSLKHRFDRFTLKKIQHQLSPAGIRYEITVKGRMKGKGELYEFLFDSMGCYLDDQIIEIETYTNEF